MHSPKWLPAAAVFLLTMFWSATALANLGSYAFTSGTGSRVDISSGSTNSFTGNDLCSGTNLDDNGRAAVDIGFTFRFDGIDYTKFSVSTNGLIGLYKSWGNTM